MPSDLKVIPEFIPKILGKAEVSAIEEDEIFNIKASLGEALVNAVKYGNKMNPSLYVDVSLEVLDDRVIIKVKDQGEGFDFKNPPDPTTDENLEKLSGRGLFLIKGMMDEVEFFDCGRGIKMVKFIKEGGSS